MHSTDVSDWLTWSIPHRILWFDGGNAVWLEGPERYEEAVVGESFYQAHLEHVTGRGEFGAEPMRVGAWLVAEIDNPHDPNAVAVWIRGGKVGHMPRHRAASWQPVIMAFRRRYGLCPACDAEIRGGWKLRQPEADGRSHAFYGVKLVLPVLLS